MAVAGFSFLAALLIAAFLGLNGGIALFCCAVVFAVASLILLNKQWGKRLAIVGLSAACACGVFLAATTLEIRKTSSLDEKTGVVTGEITNIVKRGSSTGYTLRTSKVDLPRAPQRLELVFYPYRTADLRLHDVIEVEMELSVRPRNAYLTETSGVRVLGLQSGEIKILAPEKRSFWYYLHKVKSRMQAGVNPYVDTEVEAITKGVVFGEDEGIDYTTQLVWSRAGISHLFSASGMHLAILSQTLMLLLGCLRVPKRASAGIVMGFVLLFMALLDFRMSILRAGIVSLCYYGGKLIRRDADSLNSMGLAAIIILLPNPFAIFDLSFLYSYFSSLGIILLAGRMERAIFERFGVKSKLWQWVFGCFCVSLSANLFILPLNLLFSDEFSVVGLLVNVLLAPYIQVMIPLGMFCYLIGAVPLFAWLAQAGCWLLSLIIRTVCDAAGWLIRLPYAYLPAGYGFLRIWLAASLLIAAAAWLLWRLRKAPEGESPVLRKRLGSQLTGLCAALCALVLLTGICADTFLPRR